jgi:hypothetical protein
MTALYPTLQACTRALSMLDGDAFQTAITSLVSKNHCDFQAVPPLPHGDGGLDGLVGDSIGYCCYGIEDTQEHNAKKLTSLMVNKFKGDLLRVCEFDRNSKTKLIARENKTLEAVLVNGAKLKSIYLVCNVFESNAAIGKLREFFDKLKKAGKGRFVDAACSITIEGPKEITNRLPVPQDFHATVENAVLQKIFNEPPADPSTPPALTVFEQKIQALVKVFGAAKITPIEERLRSQWIAHLARLERLNDQLPREYFKVAEIINDIRQEAPMHFIGVPVKEAITRMLAYQNELEQRLMKEVPLTETNARRAAGEIAAALVGECGIEWRDL